METWKLTLPNTTIEVYDGLGMRLGSGKKYMQTYFGEQNIFQSFYVENIKDNLSIILSNKILNAQFFLRS